jgi:6-phosphofructokinase 1
MMGHNAGWLALGAGLAGGADVILIPEIPYDLVKIAQAIRQRQLRGTRFSIVAVAEGALSIDDFNIYAELKKKKNEVKENGNEKTKKKTFDALDQFSRARANHALRLSQQLEEMTGLESRITILGHLQRGGTPSATDRVLATRLGSACVKYIEEGVSGVMVAVRGDGTEAVPLEQVVGKRHVVPADHSLLESARRVGTCLGD